MSRGVANVDFLSERCGHVDLGQKRQICKHPQLHSHFVRRHARRIPDGVSKAVDFLQHREEAASQSGNADGVPESNIQDLSAPTMTPQKVLSSKHKSP